MDPTRIHQIEFAQNAHAQAGTFGILATIFNQRPEVSLVRNLRTAGVEFFNSLRQGDGLNSEAQEGLSEISQYVSQIQAQPERDTELSLQVDWTRLFRGVQPGYGPKPPYEGVYVGEAGGNFEVLEAVARFYGQHGVVLVENAGNRPDYIGLELDFLRYLCEQQAEAWEKGDEGDAQQWQLAERDFLIDHLGRWAAIYFDQAIEEAKTDFYRGLAHLTKGMIEEMTSAL